MQNSGKDNFQTCTNDRSIAARYAPIHSMLTELLAKTDPDGYALMLQDFRDQYKPEGGEAHLVEFMADLAWRIQGCFYLENEILTQGIEACGPKDDPGLALARAFMRNEADILVLDEPITGQGSALYRFQPDPTAADDGI